MKQYKVKSGELEVFIFGNDHEDAIDKVIKSLREPTLFSHIILCEEIGGLPENDMVVWTSKKLSQFGIPCGDLSIN